MALRRALPSALIEAGRALAFLRGRDYVLPEDVVDLAPDVLRHRVVPSYEALAEGTQAPIKSCATSCARIVRARSSGQPCPCRDKGGSPPPGF